MKAKTSIWLGACLLIVGMALLAFWKIKIMHWEVADGFKGWAVVKFGDTACVGPSSSSSGRIIVDDHGRGCASFDLPSGWMIDRYAYVQRSGNRVSIPTESSGVAVWPLSYNPASKTYIFFVGTREEHDRSWQSEPKPL